MKNLSKIGVDGVRENLVVRSTAVKKQQPDAERLK